MKKLFVFLITFHLMVMPIKAHAFIGGMGQITGIAIAGVGVSLASGGCALPTPSILMYSAGAAAYLMGEMNAARAHKSATDESNEEANELKESGLKGGELQKASLELQLKQKKEDLKLANKRKTWAMAATAIFLAAAGVSALELPPFVPPAGCSPASASAIGAPLAAGVVGAYSFIAGGNLMNALLGAVAGAALSMSGIIGTFNVGPTRSVAMFGVAALVALAASEAGSAAGKLEDEIEDLEKVLAQFKAETDGKGPNTEDVTGGASSGVTSGATSGSLAGTTSGAGAGAGGASSGSGPGVTPLPDGVSVRGPTTCLNSSQQLSSNCSNPMTFSSPNLAVFGNQPELQQVANRAAEFGNAAARGDFGRADVAAASLASQAAKMKDLLKKNTAAMNKKLVAQGKKPVDLEKESQDMLKSLQSGYQKETAGKNAQLASFGLDKLSLDPSKADGSGLEIKAAAADSAIAVPTSSGAAAQAVDESALGANSASANSNDLAGKTRESAADALGKNLADYETGDNDISKSSGDSLWKQVSNRYLLNYDRFFEKKKLPSQ